MGIHKKGEHMNNIQGISYTVYVEKDTAQLKARIWYDSIKVEYEFDNRKVYFYLHSKFAFLNRNKDNNYYFTISLKRDWKYNYYEEDEGVKEKIELNGQELANKITFWTHQVQREKENVI